LAKSQIAERSADAQQVVRAAELEEANDLLRVKLNTARLKLMEVEHREWTLTSENEALKRDLESAGTTLDAMVKDKVVV
jgi:hypothetical protein